MLKLQIFLPAERVIVDKEEMASLINVLDSVTVEADDQSKIKDESAVPLSWQIFAIWRKTDVADGKKKFEQRLELLRPDGSSVFEVIQPLKLDTTHFNFRAITKIGAMPIGQEGILALKMYLRETGEVNQWQEMSEYFIHVIYKKKEEVKSATKKRRAKKRHR